MQTVFDMGAGSPPQVRGKRICRFDISHTAGITPAGAGKTRWCFGWSGFRKDHPRRCGENHKTSNFNSKSWGSPPQVRGKRRRYTYSPPKKRITPAGAGKTILFAKGGQGMKDHPRRCGENN